MTYNEFIHNIINTRGQWSNEVRYSDRGCERHHILPRCLGGEPKKLDWSHHENIVWLYPSEHFIAHKLLYLENNDNHKLAAAWLMIAFPKGDTHREFEITEIEYEELRKAASFAASVINKGNTYCLGRILSDETKRKIGASNKGNKNSVGRVLSESTRLKISNTLKNKPKKLTIAEKMVQDKVITKNDIIDLYIHGASMNDINNKYNISSNIRSQIFKLLDINYNDLRILKSNYIKESELNAFINTYNKDEFENYYRCHNSIDISSKFKLNTIYTHINTNDILQIWSIEKRSSKETNNIKIKTLYSNYGISNNFQRNDVIEKCKKTKFDRYGDEYYSNQDLAKKTKLERYGTLYMHNLTVNCDDETSEIIE